MLGSRQPAYIAWGPDCLSLYNDGYIPILANKHPEALGRPYREVFPEIWEDYRPIIAATLAGEAQHFVDQPVSLAGRPSAPMSWFTFAWTPLRDDHGEIGGFYCAATETTDRVIADHAFRRLFEASPAPLLVLAPDAPRFTILEVNDAYLQATLCRREQLIGCGVFEAFPGNPADPAGGGAPSLKASLDRVIAERRADAMPRQKYDIRRPDGGFEERWWDPVNSPVLGPDGAVVALIHHVDDRTAAERRESALRASEERLRALVTASASSMYRMSPDWSDVRELDGGALASSGGSCAHWLEHHVLEADRARVLSAIRQAIVDRKPFELEHRIALPDGSVGWAQLRAVPMLGANGEVAEWFGASGDITARKSAEQALKQSEARYQALFEAIDTGFCIVEVMFDEAQRPVDYRFVEANPAFERQTGLSGALGGTARQLIPDLEPHWFEIYGRIAVTGEPERFENGSDAMGRWFDVYAFRTGEPDERRVAILFNDITQRRNAEASLRRLNERLEAEVAERTAERDRIWQLSPDLMCLARTDSTLLSVNPAWERLLGWGAEELTGRYAAEFKHPDDEERTRVELSRLAAGGHRTLNFEDRYRHKDGSWRWISWVVEQEGGLLYCIGRDVTAEKTHQAQLAAAEAARRDADALYRAYFENSPEALFVIAVEPDGRFRVEQVNSAHEAGVGLKANEVRGRLIDDLLPADVAERVLQSYRQVVESGSILQYREVFDLGGDPQHWDTSIVPVRDAEGRIHRLIGSSRNVTRQVLAEEALRQAQKMEAMGQLTGGVAHDFNNLLTPIVGSLDMLQRAGLGGPREQRLIAGAAQSAERAATLVQRLLAFARRQPLQAVPVDVAQVIAGMGDLVASTTGPQIKVVVDAPAELPPAKADPNQLEMALLNLAVNARDAMPEGGALRISASAETVGRGHPTGLAPGPYVRLSVADTGAGMDEATLARAIEPFFSTKGVGKGTGLGLSMVHGLASQLGGALTLQSRPGLGTNVELWLPAGQAEAAPAQPAARAPIGRQAGRVLLVDDEELVRATTADMLTELGYEVAEAGSGAEALALLEGGLAPDLLVTDHLMPGMTGTELARRMAAQRPGGTAPPCLIISGYAEVDGIAPELPRLTKPFRQADLAAAIGALRRAGG